MANEEDGEEAMPHRDYEKRVTITDAETRAIALVKLALNDSQQEFYRDFGVNRADAEAMEEFRRDMRFVRQFRQRKGIYDDLAFLNAARTTTVKAGMRFFMAVVTLMAAGFVAGIIFAFKAWIDVLINRPHP